MNPPKYQIGTAVKVKLRAPYSATITLEQEVEGYIVGIALRPLLLKEPKLTYEYGIAKPMPAPGQAMITTFATVLEDFIVTT